MNKYKDFAEGGTSVNCHVRGHCYGHVPKQDGKERPKAYPARFSVPKNALMDSLS